MIMMQTQNTANRFGRLTGNALLARKKRFYSESLAVQAGILRELDEAKRDPTRWKRIGGRKGAVLRARQIELRSREREIRASARMLCTWMREDGLTPR